MRSISLRDGLERLDPVAQPRGVLEAEVAREPLQLRPQLRQRVLERLPLDALQGARGELRASAALQRAELGRLRRADDAVAAAAEVDVTVGSRGARVRRRTQLADQPQLLERRLELRAERRATRPLERAERGLDRRPLPLGAEVRAQPRAQVARASDVEHLVVRVAEEVHAGTLRRAECEMALPVHATRPRRRELDEVGDGARAALLRHPDQREQDLGRRLRVRQRAVARPRIGREAVRERGEVRGLPAEQPPREPDGVDDGRRDAVAGEPHRLVVEERHVEARVVRDEDGVAREGEEAARHRRDRRRAAQLARRAGR